MVGSLAATLVLASPFVTAMLILWKLTGKVFYLPPTEGEPPLPSPRLQQWQAVLDASTPRLEEEPVLVEATHER